jgi:lipid II:glycine glycyltransferase (peptidoglycan interpeptide bridge formation enzyme)
LILGDYQAVMPITYLKLKRNLFIKRIYQPDFCQQLGIFSLQKLDQKTTDSFIKSLIKLKPKTYNFNHFNSKEYLKHTFNLKERINYELDLNQTYDSIYSSFSSNTKRNLKKAIKSQIIIREDLSIENFIKFKEELIQYKTNKKQLKKMKRLIHIALTENSGKIYAIYQANVLVAAAFFLIDSKRFTSLISASNEMGKKSGAITFLYNHIIRSNVKENITLDFEGSMIAGVARFYKNFGAKESNYLSLMS